MLHITITLNLYYRQSNRPRSRYFRLQSNILARMHQYNGKLWPNRVQDANNVVNKYVADFHVSMHWEAWNHSGVQFVVAAVPKKRIIRFNSM